MSYTFNPFTGNLDVTPFSLDGAGKIPSDYLPSYVDDVVEYDDLAGFPGTGETGKIYVAKDTGYTYRWTGSVYVRIGSGGEVELNLGSEGSPSLFFNGDANTGLYSPGANQLAISTNGTGRLFVDASGRVGVGTTSPGRELEVYKNDSQAAIAITASTTGQSSLYFADTADSNIGAISYTHSDNALTFRVNDGERLRIDSSGNVGIGTTSPAAKLHIENGDLRLEKDTKVTIGFRGHSTGSTALAFRDANAAIDRMTIDASGRLLVGTSSTSGISLVQIQGYSGAATGVGLLELKKGSTTPADGDALGALYFSDSGSNRGAQITGIRDGGTWTSGSSQPGRLVFSTTADGASSPTERMRIDRDGKVAVSRGGSTEGDEAFSAGSASTGSIRVFTVTSLGNSTAAAAIWTRKNSSTDRSINAAGTVNASGADYAEYMTKAGDFTIAKGDICGIDPNGKLTNVFANAVGFVVKSTDPSYVGGDSWGADIEDPVQLETERQKVDRIAFAGQVPVNLTGANPGQYIVPIETDDGGITGIAKDETDLTLAEYMSAVGKVIAIENDGRARIIVKVA
jgi:hypothetical protein